MTDKIDIESLAKERWQIISDDSVWMFPADIRLSTVELIKLLQIDSYNFETCIFYIDGRSEVLDVYKTKEAAIEGHKRHEEQYGLKFKGERVIK